MALAQLSRSSSLRWSALKGMVFSLRTDTFANQLAAKLKLNAPYAHTWLEIVHARWGVVAHLVFMFFGSVVLNMLLFDVITNMSDSG
jgi:hypothetical protein